MEQQAIRVMIVDDHQMVRDGLMATRLGISLGTIQLHVTHILRKLGVRNRTEAALFAVQHRLVA